MKSQKDDLISQRKQNTILRQEWKERKIACWTVEIRGKR